jgi:hypothetical protein
MILLEPANTITRFNVEIKRRTMSLTGIDRRAVRAGLYPPPHSLSSLTSAVYRPPIARIWPENHDSPSNQRITFPATVPHLFPDSLNATVAVPFLNGNGRQIRCLARLAKRSCKTIDQIPEGEPVPKLTMDDYFWELAAGGDDIDLNAMTWKDSFGTRYSPDILQQGYLVVLMEALRDVEARFATSRTSPLQQIINQRGIPENEQAELVGFL